MPAPPLREPELSVVVEVPGRIFRLETFEGPGRGRGGPKFFFFFFFFKALIPKSAFWDDFILFLVMFRVG